MPLRYLYPRQRAVAMMVANHHDRQRPADASADLEGIGCVVPAAEGICTTMTHSRRLGSQMAARSSAVTRFHQH
jgi:hypothetical protein